MFENACLSFGKAAHLELLLCNYDRSVQSQIYHQTIWNLDLCIWNVSHAFSRVRCQTQNGFVSDLFFSFFFFFPSHNLSLPGFCLISCATFMLLVALALNRNCGVALWWGLVLSGCFFVFFFVVHYQMPLPLLWRWNINDLHEQRRVYVSVLW